VIETEFKECPQCAETIRSKAVRCRYCGAELDGVDLADAEDAGTRRALLGITALLGLVAMFAGVVFVGWALGTRGEMAGKCERLARAECRDSSVGESVCSAHRFYHCAVESAQKGECQKAARAYCRDYIRRDVDGYFGGLDVCEAQCESRCLMSRSC
jgi:hypothetical protein